MTEDVPTVTERVVTAVTAESGRERAELPPLYDSIDPEKLEIACETLDSGEVSFRYANHLVTARADESVEVTNTDGSQPSLSKRAADD